MLQNNGARLNVWKELENPFDYAAFSAKCAEQNVTPMSNVDFAQKVGMLLSARSAYPSLEIEQAYVMFVQESMTTGSAGWKSGIVEVRPNGNTTYSEAPIDISSDLFKSLSQGGTSCCGGGSIK